MVTKEALILSDQSNSAMVKNIEQMKATNTFKTTELVVSLNYLNYCVEVIAGMEVRFGKTIFRGDVVKSFPFNPNKCEPNHGHLDSTLKMREAKEWIAANK